MVLLIGLFVLGAAVALVAMRRFDLPMGTAVGAGLLVIVLGTAAWDYLWYPVQKARLSETETAASVTAEANPLRPWTMAVPSVVRFVAVEQAGARGHGNAQYERIVPLVFRGRYEAELRVEVLFDCLRARRAAIVAGTVFDADGMVSAPDWSAPQADDPVTEAACALDISGAE